MLGILLLALGVSAAWAEPCSAPIGVRNYAKHGIVRQSSTYDDKKLYPGPELAIDGNNDNKYSQGSCTHTMKDFEPWWSVDLKHSIRVGTVVLTNRMDCCHQRLLGAEVMVSDSAHDGYKVCGVIDDVSQPTIPVCCDGIVGRHVTVRIPKRAEFLSLCEAEVYEHVEDKKVRPEEVAEAE